MEQISNKVPISKILILQLGALIFSLSNVCSKYAAQHPFLSWEFILLYGASLGILFLYAVLWQQVLKTVPLLMAYSNRLVSMVWGVVWGAILFQEQISLTNVLGTAVIIYGLYTMGKVEE